MLSAIMTSSHAHCPLSKSLRYSAPPCALVDGPAGAATALCRSKPSVAAGKEWCLALLLLPSLLLLLHSPGKDILGLWAAGGRGGGSCHDRTGSGCRSGPTDSNGGCGGAWKRGALSALKLGAFSPRSAIMYSCASKKATKIHGEKSGRPDSFGLAHYEQRW